MTIQRFTDRSILVTGGASGIGRAAALAFAGEGGLISLADIDEEQGQSVVEEIESLGSKARFFRFDAADENSIMAMIAGATTAFGPIRHAFNNVGMPRNGSVENMSLEDWNWTLSMSLTSTFLCMKHEIPGMRSAGGGTIVNTASTSGKFFTPAASPAYSAAKAGVVHLSHYASCAYANEGIRVNSISPGLTATKMVNEMLSQDEQVAIARELHIITRAVMPEEIAATVLFLSSDGAAMITGTDTEVCGGRR
ncbi:SDR family oxidoreductase (plasmid) [Sphingobium sp. SJ10-10]|uniref:SDR family NAD(P)-dependent oxidoreductase n=1 Tax=unclassified Sphingobium TaxID=2611147 RepID=UPI00076FED69|nr:MULTISPECIES: SDR family oxidoreductase [unclassified Sphingobium]AMK26526.1 short-chain dehydrogenase/reductase SDR [Sphingobium sp. TKS]MEC6699551.1 SDR family oxidoreductase [Sphingobium sp. SJ10-10]